MAKSSAKRKLTVKAKALKLAKLGLYVGPVCPNEKNLGSRLGKGWQEKTSIDPNVISGWFEKHPDDGLFLHAGRSGLIIFDLDTDDGLDSLPKDIAEDLRLGIFQRSREAGDRGHYIFRTDESFGSSPGGFSAWGDIRGGNTGIVLAPSIHRDTGKPYKHVRGDWNNIPKLPAALRALLRTGTHDPRAALPTEQLTSFLDSLTRGSKYELLDNRCIDYRNNVLEGESRHGALLKIALRVMQDAKNGEYPAPPAMERLRQEFEASFAVETKGRRGKPANGEFEGIIAWAAAQQTTTEGLESLFDSTPELRMVRRYAQERLVSPVALLAVGVARALVALPPRYVLPAIVGGQAPLNMFLALTGQSGSGKGATEDVGGEVFQFSSEVEPDVYPGRPGSSEGIAKMYGHMVSKKDGKRSKQVAEYLRTRVLASLPEVDSLTALMGRDGSMIAATLREVWTGSHLGNDYAHAHTKFLVGARTYRFCLLLGVQPNRAETLLNQRDGGLLQRFLWVEVTMLPSQFREPTGDTSDLKPIVLPTLPDEVFETQKWLLEMGSNSGPDDLIDLNIPAEVIAQIRAVQTLIRQNLTSDLEGHRLLTQEKIAMGLALIHGKIDGFTMEHWLMAGLLLQHSDDTLHRIREAASARHLSNRMREAETAGRVRAVRSAAEELALVKSTKSRLTKILAQYDQIAGAKLRAQISVRQREVFHLAIGELHAERVIGKRTTQAVNGTKSTFYYLLASS